MTIVFDMANGNIQSEPVPAKLNSEQGNTRPATALQLTQTIECDSTQQDATAIHIIHALLRRD